MDWANISGNIDSAEFFEDYHHPIGAFAEDTGNNADYTYLNAGTCPDCGGAMVRLGRCFSCMSCGFASCGG